METSERYPRTLTSVDSTYAPNVNYRPTFTRKLHNVEDYTILRRKRYVENSELIGEQLEKFIGVYERPLGDL